MRPLRSLHKRRRRAERRQIAASRFTPITIELCESWFEGDTVKFSDAIKLVEVRILKALQLPASMFH